MRLDTVNEYIKPYRIIPIIIKLSILRDHVWARRVLVALTAGVVCVQKAF